ncbi:MAG: hypothetical protein O3A46_11530 [Candidatus Poribacteria bacterium]|nr:hypothetical protein [Candidatus Poribacteria bacterium]
MALISPSKFQIKRINEKRGGGGCQDPFALAAAINVSVHLADNQHDDAVRFAVRLVRNVFKCGAFASQRMQTCVLTYILALDLNGFQMTADPSTIVHNLAILLDGDSVTDAEVNEIIQWLRANAVRV